MDFNFQYFKFQLGMTIQILDSEFNTTTIKAVPDNNKDIAYTCEHCALKDQKRLCQTVNCNEFGGFHFIKLKKH
jgi:hypothetical protein